MLGLPVVAGSLAVGLLVTSSAGADTVLVSEGSESHLPAFVDLTGARYVSDADGFSARLSVRDLKLRTATVGFTLTFPRSEQVFRVSTTRTKGGKQVYLVTRDRSGKKPARTCAEFVSTWDDTRDRVDIHVPWSCLGDQRATMKVSGRLHSGTRSASGTGDSVKTVRVAYT
ncbi:hypothetical protein [Sporichthya polymorpha]|uniref:hypothetical protein n=1 Tax=Sporichthya polymorpha TaxID=35751 RepID=UPI00036FDC57|nr:hypothetical protein [Sporichthya polymorpha]